MTKLLKHAKLQDLWPIVVHACALVISTFGAIYAGYAVYWWMSGWSLGFLFWSVAHLYQNAKHAEQLVHWRQAMEWSRKVTAAVEHWRAMGILPDLDEPERTATRH